jgi:hypothetical protein
VPAGAPAAAIVPELSAAADALAALHRTTAGLPGAGDLAAAREAVAAQLGLDPLDPAALRGAGLDPRRGGALALLPPAFAGADGRRGPPLLVLPVRDRAALEATLARLARDRLGAAVRAEGAFAPGVIAFSVAPGGPPALSLAHVEGGALCVPGEAGPRALAALLALPEGEALSASAPFAAARAALGERAAVAWFPPGSPLLAALPRRPPAGAALGLAAGARSARATLALPLGDLAADLRALAPGAGDGARHAARLDPAAPLAAAWNGDPRALGERLGLLLSPDDRARLELLKLSPLPDVLALAAPGAALSAALSPRLDLAGLDPDAVRRDPLRVVWFELAGEVRDPERVRAVSAVVAGAARGLGRPAPADPDGAFRIPTATGEVAWRVDGTRFLLAGGAPGRLAALAARAEDGGFRAPSPASAAALRAALGGAALDAPRLAGAVRALPAEAFGTGPSGFVLRSLVGRLVEPAARLRAASLRADLEGRVLLVTAELEAREDAP